MTEFSAARELLEAVIAAFAVLGGVMAYMSGYAAAQADAEDARPEDLAYAISLGVATGFRYGVPAALTALIIAVWS